MTSRQFHRWKLVLTDMHQPPLFTRAHKEAFDNDPWLARCQIPCFLIGRYLKTWCWFHFKADKIIRTNKARNVLNVQVQRLTYQLIFMFSMQAKCYLKKYLVPRWAHEKFRFLAVGPWSRIYSMNLQSIVLRHCYITNSSDSNWDLKLN
jgi:hypothetical protein